MNFLRKFLGPLKYLAPGVLVLGIVVMLGVAESRFDLVNSPQPQLFRSGLYVGSASVSPESDQDNKISSTLSTTLTYDAPALVAGLGHKVTVALSGAEVGSPCMVGARAHGSNSIDPSLSIQCAVESTGVVSLRFLNGNVDGGASIDPGDAGYKVRVFQ